MLDTSPETELSSALTHSTASASHPVPPVGGNYVWVDATPMLAAAGPGPISAVLVLPRVDQSADYLLN